MAFLSSYIVIGAVLPTDQYMGGMVEDASAMEDRVKTQLHALATKCTLDVRFKGFKASDVAGAILYCTRRQVGIVPAWRTELTLITKVDPSVEGVVREIAAMIDGLSDVMPPFPPSKEDVSESLYSTPTQQRGAPAGTRGISEDNPLFSMVDAVAAQLEKAKTSKASPTTITFDDEQNVEKILMSELSCASIT